MKKLLSLYRSDGSKIIRDLSQVIPRCQAVIHRERLGRHKCGSLLHLREQQEKGLCYYHAAVQKGEMEPTSLTEINGKKFKPIKLIGPAFND